MSTPVFVDPEIFTQADGAQSSRVPVPLPEDPYEVIRQAYLVETDTESYQLPSSSSSLAFPVWKRYRATSELILDTDSEEDEIRDKDTDEDEGHGLD
ncbi:hypothetical protein Tco_1396360, partial [Tanacetum coccineum]